MRVRLSIVVAVMLLTGVAARAQSSASQSPASRTPSVKPKLRGRDQVLRDIAKNNSDEVVQDVRGVMDAYEVDMYRLVLRVGKRYGMDTAYDIMSEGVAETRSRWADQAITDFKPSGTEVEQGLAFYRKYLGATDDEFKVMELTKDKVIFKRKDYVNAIFHACETLGLDPVTVNNKVYAPATTLMLARVNPGLKHSFIKYDGDGWYEEMIAYTPVQQTKGDAVQTGTSAAQAAKDASAPQPVMLYRFYAGTDGLSHVEKIELKDFDVHNAISLMAGNGIPTIHRDKPSPPGTDLSKLPFHPAARRQYIFNLQGRAEIEFSGGEKITLNPGDIELAEDLAPAKGHRNLILGPEDRISAWFPITDQTPVIGPLSK